MRLVGSVWMRGSKNLKRFCCLVCFWSEVVLGIEKWGFQWGKNKSCQKGGWKKRGKKCKKWKILKVLEREEMMVRGGCVEGLVEIKKGRMKRMMVECVYLGCEKG